MTFSKWKAVGRSAFFTGFLFLLSFSCAFAMEVRPPILELSAKPGESTGSIFFLTNTESVPQTYVFGIQGFVAQGDEGQQTFLSASETEGLPSWLYLREPRVTLAPGASVSIPVVFRPPLGARPGAYQAVVFSSAANAPSHEGVRLGSRVGVLVFAMVEGDVRRMLTIRSFKRLSPSFIQSSLPRFEVVLVNEGDAHEISTGQVIIKNVFGQIVEILSLQRTGHGLIRILPGSERRFKLEYDPKDFAFTGWGLGWYRAELSLDEPFEARADAGWFFVLPWKTLSVAFLGTVVWFLLRRRTRTR